MAKPYETIQNYYGTPMYQGQLTQSLQAFGGGINTLPGVQIVNAVPNPKTLLGLFNAFVAYIRAPGNGCRWAGGLPGGAGYKLLEGDLQASQCSLFANAFYLLAWAPPPYGLGLPKAQLTVDTYLGRYKLGFVSAHAGLVVGLPANVAGQNLYFWDNHKVVHYQNTFYDVMYNNTYAQKEDMALYHVMENKVKLAPPDVPVAVTYYPTEPTQHAAALHPGVQGIWFKESAGQYGGPSVSMPF